MSLTREEGILLILDFLNTEQYYKSVIALEQDSKLKLKSYGTEINFFYDLIMDGMFPEAEKMILPIETRNPNSHSAILFEIRKEAFLEKVEGVSTHDVQELVKTLKDLEALAGKEEFNNLCYILSLNKLTDHPEYADWSCWKGRHHCFQQSLKYLADIYQIPQTQPLSSTLWQLLGVQTVAKQDPISPRLLKSGVISPHLAKESERYSLDLHKSSDEEQSSVRKVEESEVTEQESEATEQESETTEQEEESKKRDPTQAQVSEDKRVYVETLDIVSGTDDASGLDEDNYHPPQDLFQRFDPRSLHEVTRIEDVQPIRASVFNSTGEYFVLGTNSKSIKVCSMHNIIDGLLYNQHRSQAIEVVFEMKNLHLGSVYCVDWSRSGTQIASGSNDKTIKVVFCPDFLAMQETQPETVIYSNGSYLTGEGDLPDIKEVLLSGHKSTVRTLCYHPLDDHILLSGGIVDSEIKIWNTEQGQCVQRLNGHNGAIYSIVAAGDGKFFASVGTDKRIRIWDLRSARSVLQLNGDAFTEMNSVALNVGFQQLRADGKNGGGPNFAKSPIRGSGKPSELAAVSHVDGMVSLWDITAGKLQSKYSYHSGDCRAVEFSADANWLVSASFDSTIGVLDVHRGTVRRITDHSDRVVSVRWHPYLPIVLSTSADKTARVFCP